MDDLTKRILSLSWPIIVTQLFNMLYNLIDAFWIGNLEGTAAVAAIQISWPIFGMIISIGFGFSFAAVALIAQYTGAKLDDRASYVSSQIIGTTFIFSLILAVAGYLFTPSLIGFLHVEEAVALKSMEYVRIIILGIPFIFITIACDGIYRGKSRMVLSMSIMSLSAIINIILDPLFIEGYGFFPALGISGAAVATIISYIFSAVISLWLLHSGRIGVKTALSDMKPERKEVSRIMRIGLPAMVGHGGSSIGFFLLMYIIALVPDATVALAGYGIGDRLMSMITMFSMGIGAACTTMVGEALGREDKGYAERVVKRSLEISFIISSLLALVAVALRFQFVGIFIKDAAAIAEGSSFIALFAIGMPFFAIFSIANGAFAGSGHNVPAMITELARLIALRIPLSYALGIALGMGAGGIWVGMAISNVIAALIGIMLLSTDGWKEKVIEPAADADQEKIVDNTL